MVQLALLHFTRETCVNYTAWIARILKFVCLELVAPVELLAANVTLEQFQVQMPSLVILFVSVGDERFAAESARKWFFPRVGLDVVGQTRAMLEDLHARHIGTLVLLHPADNLHRYA
jgi:hypothetical protein